MSQHNILECKWKTTNIGEGKRVRRNKISCNTYVEEICNNFATDFNLVNGQSAIVESETSGSISINTGEECKPRSGALADSVVATSVVVVIELIPLWIETSYAERSVPKIITTTHRGYMHRARSRFHLQLRMICFTLEFRADRSRRNDRKCHFVRANGIFFFFHNCAIFVPPFLRPTSELSLKSDKHTMHSGSIFRR